VEAAQNIDTIKSQDCRDWGMKFTLDNIAPMYKRYFTQILNLHYTDPKLGGWYKM